MPPGFPPSPTPQQPPKPPEDTDQWELVADPSLAGAFFSVILAVAIVVALVARLASSREGTRAREWDTGFAPRPSPARRRDQGYASLVAALDAIRARDPEFSYVLFEDFLAALYVEAHTARGRGTLAYLTPYLSVVARSAIGAAGPVGVEVRSILIGTLKVDQVRVGRIGEPTVVSAVFEANYEEIDARGGVTAYYTAERWTLTRAAGARSRPPERVRIFDCPGCGAPLDKLMGGTCGYCSRVVDRGDLDWLVTWVSIEQREARPPMLTGTSEEVGTSDPTVVAPDVMERWNALVRRDPSLGWAGLSARLDLIFRSFHQAWRAQDLTAVRPFLADNLFQAQVYWVEAYRRQGLWNRTDGARIVGVHLARIVSDARYDAITLRVFATGLDYTVDASGEVVGGSRDHERAYSEYWTLIRGVDRRGPPRGDLGCPSCGAPLAINMAGHCTHCGAKLTAGAFDWVLSRIEQDESYG
jgi:predicted lipid-binding transport protein (Tim44 family)